MHMCTKKEKNVCTIPLPRFQVCPHLQLIFPVVQNRCRGDNKKHAGGVGHCLHKAQAQCHTVQFLTAESADDTLSAKTSQRFALKLKSRREETNGISYENNNKKQTIKT